MKWSKIVNIHRTIEKLPENKELLKSLYPEAFDTGDITQEIELQPHFLASNKFHIKIILKKKQVYEVATILISKKMVYVPQSGDNPSEQKISYPLKINVAYGFKVEILPKDQDGGLRVWQYGYIDEEKTTKAVKK